MFWEKKWINELPGKRSFPSPAHLIAFPPSHAQGINPSCIVQAVNGEAAGVAELSCSKLTPFISWD